MSTSDTSDVHQNQKFSQPSVNISAAFCLRRGAVTKAFIHR